MVIVPTLIFAFVPCGMNILRPVILLSVLAVISTFAGSRRYVPSLSPPAAVTLPKACRLSLLEVSTNPPNPESEPFAEIDPWKLV